MTVFMVQGHDSVHGTVTWQCSWYSDMAVFMVEGYSDMTVFMVEGYSDMTVFVVQ